MDPSDAQPGFSQDPRLGDVLRDARVAKNMELSDIAEVTHVRKEYLRALEEARFGDLPEDIYAKNFVRLYAQTVGLKEDLVLELYNRERGQASGVVPGPAQAQANRPEAQSTYSRTVTSPQRRPLQIGAWVPTLLLIAAVVGLALWGFNSLLFRPSPANSPVTSSDDTVADTGADVDEAVTAVPEVEATPDVTPPAEADAVAGEELSRLTLITDPPGAEVNLDGFPLGTTPIQGQPLTAGAPRDLRVTLDGYTPYEAAVNLTEDLNLTLTLTPAETPTSENVALTETGSSTPPPTTSGQLSVAITAPTWFEAYQSTQRGNGERLVYTTAQPGQTYSFALPVYLHVGNGGGVTVAMNGQEVGAMGSSGEVVSRAYSP